MGNNRKRLIRNDIILIVFFVMVAIGTGIYLYAVQENPDVLKLQIIIDGEIVEEYDDLLKDEVYKEIVLDTGNTIVIDNGQVYVEEADCPDGLCVKQGKIRRAGESIICLPHKLIIRIVGESSAKDEQEYGDASQGLDVMPR